MTPSTRIAISLILLELIAAMWLLAPNGSDHYDARSRAYQCTSPRSCQHESGHALDHALGWISLSPAWIAAVDRYRAEASADPLYGEIANFPGVGAPRWPCQDPRQLCYWQGWGGYTELYADILRMANGDVESIPTLLRSFYEPSGHE